MHFALLSRQHLFLQLALSLDDSHPATKLLLLNLLEFLLGESSGQVFAAVVLLSFTTVWLNDLAVSWGRRGVQKDCARID